MPLVKAIVVAIWRGLPSHADLDDLLQAGSVGLLDAVRKFNASKGVPFAVYAKFRIRGAVLDSLRNLDEMGRADRRRLKLQNAQEAVAQTANAGSATDSASEQIPKYVPSLRSRIPVHAASTWDAHDGEERTVDPASTAQSPEQLYGRTVIRKLLADTVSELPERHQQIINMYYEGDLTMREIGGVIGVNESRVSQIHKSAIRKMGVALAERGYASGDILGAALSA